MTAAHARQVKAFYDRHPINEAQILAVLARRGRDLRGLAPDDLFDLDQDHYGGLAAVETLARLAGVTPASQVLDACAGLGGPARYLASRHGCRVTALELNAGRAAGAARLTRLVGLATRVRVVRGDATAMPLAAGRFDACIGQEAFLHIADKAGLVAELRRALRPGGRLAFTDWVLHAPLGDDERTRLAEWMAAANVQSIDGYRALLGQAGFAMVDAEDLSAEWGPILRDRLRMYRDMREDTVAQFGEAHYRQYVETYAFFVDLVDAGRLGGGRFIAS